MKRLLVFLLLIPPLAAASDTCRAPAGWAEDGGASNTRSSADAVAPARLDEEQIHAKYAKEMAREMGLTVDEAARYLSEVGQNVQARSSDYEDIRSRLAAALSEHADRLAQRGDSVGLLRAALLLVGNYGGDQTRAQQLIERAQLLDGDDAAVQWAAWLVCELSESTCSARAAAIALTRAQPDNIAAWWALADADEGAAAQAAAGALAASYYADIIDVLLGDLVAAHAGLELSTILVADLDRMLADVDVATAMPTPGEQLPLLYAWLQLQWTAPGGGAVQTACRGAHVSITDFDTAETTAPTADHCRDHFKRVLETTSSTAREFAYTALIELAADDAIESADWQRRQRTEEWHGFQLMKAQADGRAASGMAYWNDVVAFGDVEATRRHLTAAGIALDAPPDGWELEAAMYRWMGERIRQSQ